MEIRSVGRAEPFTTDGPTLPAQVGPSDAPGAWHQAMAGPAGSLRFLCCCAPPHRHADTFFA